MFDPKKERKVGDEILVKRDGKIHQGIFEVNDQSETPYLVSFNECASIWFYPNGDSNIGSRIQLRDLPERCNAIEE